MTVVIPFQRNSWMDDEIRRIGYARFSEEYWPALDKAISTCMESQSFVIAKSRNHSAICQWQFAEPGSSPVLAGFILVCPPFSEDVWNYGIQTTPLAAMSEIAFLAIDEGEEGKGHAKTLMRNVLQKSLLPTWLHVDTVNSKAKKLYESLGFQIFAEIPDPYGSPGYLMVHLEGGWNTHIEKRTTLFNTSRCKTEQAFSGCIFTPPLSTGR